MTPRARDAVVVVHLPGEDAQPDTDLRSGQADAVGGVHGLEHVRDEAAQVVVELLHGLGAAVEHGLTGDDDGADGHAPSLPDPF